MERNLYTWDELYKRADGCVWWDPELKAKDNAREFFDYHIQETLGYDIEKCDIPEEEIDGFLNENEKEYYFDESGHFVIAIKPALKSICFDNTNFRYEIIGNIDDNIMNQFNSMFDSKGHTATQERLKFLKENSLDLKFCEMAVKTAERNLVLSGGIELPKIIADMLYCYYYKNEGSSKGSDLTSALSYAIEKNSADYPYEKEFLKDIYERKLATMLYDMFTGMRFASPWNGKSSVSGGYIIAKNNGDVVAYHTMLADEFKEFLINQLGFERGSCTRHDYMKIERLDGKYFIKLSLQIRFKRIKESAVDSEV